MARTATSKKRDFSFESMPKVKLKSKRGARRYEPAKSFRDPARVRTALIEALEQGDPDAFKEILSAFLEVTNKDEFAKKAHISRRTLFRMLTPSGNPTLDNIARVVSALGRAA